MMKGLRIPVCVISSKDFGFLYDKIPFARIVSCIMGIETINVKRQVGNELIHINNDSNVLFDTHLITDIDTLTDNSVSINFFGKGNIAHFQGYIYRL